MTTKRKRATTDKKKRAGGSKRQAVSPVGAVDLNHQTTGVDKRPYNRERLTALCDRYISEDDKLRVDVMGLMGLMEELGIEEQDVGGLHLAFLLGWEDDAGLARAEFELALARVEVDSVAKLRAHLTLFGGVFKHDPTQFKEFYAFVFRHLRDGIKKHVTTEMALQTLPVVISVAEFPLLQKFLEFVAQAETKGEIKFITQDQWSVLLDFLHQMDPELTKYDPAAAWPCLMDDFVDWRQAQLAAK